MHPIKSIQARFQTLCSKHYHLTRQGRRMAALKDSHKGERCFVIGNGPSLSGDDLTCLAENGIPAFASNNVMKIFPTTGWRPTFYVCEDILVLEDLESRICAEDFAYKFIPVNHKWYNNIRIPGAHYFWQDYCSEGKLSDDAARRIYCKGTVTTTSIQLAAYMGFTEIYLLGVDHSYSQTTDDAGNIITDNSVKDYFDGDYASTMKKKMIPNLEATTRSYVETRQFFEPRGVKIFNATRGGKLEVFPRVDFDDLFKE